MHSDDIGTDATGYFAGLKDKIIQSTAEDLERALRRIAELEAKLGEAEESFAYKAFDLDQLTGLVRALVFERDDLLEITATPQWKALFAFIDTAKNGTDGEA